MSSNANVSRLKTKRARARARKDPAKYHRLRDLVLRVREGHGLTQAGLAQLLEVSEITVRRWETALGHFPNQKTFQRLEALDGDTR